MKKCKIEKKELKRDLPSKITDIGARLASRRILKLVRRTRFNFGRLVVRKLPEVIKWVKDAIAALKAAELEIFELRHRHKEAKRTLQNQLMHEIDTRMKVEVRHANNKDVIQAYKGLRRVVQSLQL